MSLFQAHAPALRAPSFAPSSAFAPSGGGVEIEQRRSRRARANWAARVIDAAGVVNVGRVCDVSEGGFGLMSAVHMPVGALLDVAVAVPMTRGGERSVPLRCRVRVVSCSFAGIQSRLSVEFLALPKPSRIAIRNYVVAHA